MKATLCWCCKNAVPNDTCGCCWSRQLKPVPGWTAKPTRHKTDNHQGYVYEYGSFKVTGCPQFEMDCTPEELDHPPREDVFPNGVVFVDCDTGKRYRTGLAVGRYLASIGRTKNASSVANRITQMAAEHVGEEFKMMGVTWKTEPAEFKIRSGNKPLFCITTGQFFATREKVAEYIAAILGISVSVARLAVKSHASKGDVFELAGLKWRRIKEVE